MKISHYLWAIVLGLGLSACGQEAGKTTDTTKKDSTVTTTTETTTTTLPETTSTTTTETTTASTTPSEPTVIPKVSGAEKIGYLNSQELLSLIPEAQAAEKKLADMFKGKESQYESLAKSAQDKLQRYQQVAEKLNEEERKSRETELMGLDKQLQEMQSGAENEIAKERDRLIGPILKRLDRTVAQVAKEHGFTYIIDPSVTGLVYADSSRNILPLMKAKLGLKGGKK